MATVARFCDTIDARSVTLGRFSTVGIRPRKSAGRRGRGTRESSARLGGMCRPGNASGEESTSRLHFETDCVRAVTVTVRRIRALPSGAGASSRPRNKLVGAKASPGVVAGAQGPTGAVWMIDGKPGDNRGRESDRRGRRSFWAGAVTPSGPASSPPSGWRGRAMCNAPSNR
jgi:hypothetical protein